MSTKIQISSLEALERLIGNDNELEIQIRESVVQNFTKKHLKSIATLDLIENIGKAVKTEIENEFFELTKDNYGRLSKVAFKKEILNELKEDLNREARKVLSEVIGQAIGETKSTEIIANKLRYASENIENQISDAVLTNRLDKMVEARIKERLGLK